MRQRPVVMATETTVEMIAAEAVSKMAEAMTVMVVAAAAVTTGDDLTHGKRRTTQQSASSLDDADCQAAGRLGPLWESR